MLGELVVLKEGVYEEIRQARSLHELEEIRIKYLGRKGIFTSVFKCLVRIPKEERKEIGRLANEIKNKVEALISKKKTKIKRREEDFLKRSSIDITLSPPLPDIAKKHPLTKVLDEIIVIFEGLGFQIEEGPEVESSYYNFDALNIPASHPARDMHDTFYITDEVLLRTHTSPVQIRVMERTKPPIRIIVPGKVYRRDADISHSPMFHQVEGLLVDEDTSFAELKGVLTLFVHRIFGEETRIRFRPSFFPFTEPSAEIDISCVMCKGNGCGVCKTTGFVEILGAGMVDPEVFKAVGYDPERFSGFAFGMGVERIAMLKYGIDNIRLFFENDLRFLEQF
ncbi:MAG: phenylalanine--tRNA ligase subunit alpha [bacterium]|nr:phenylalanine--tRNA ligase subunit alpha [bacterium]